MFYTNADQFPNKRDELLLVIAGDEPDIIILTEVLPKVLKYPLNPACIALPNYDMYLSFDPLSPEFGSGRRGLAMHVKEGVKCREARFLYQDFNESMWLEIDIATRGTLLVGAIYRSPSSVARNNEALCKLLRSATYAGYDQVLIVGDFNLPNIDWETKMFLDASTHFSHVFVETIQDCYLSQEVSEPTRYREGNHILISLILFSSHRTSLFGD